MRNTVLSPCIYESSFEQILKASVPGASLPDLFPLGQVSTGEDKGRGHVVGKIL